MKQGSSTADMRSIFVAAALVSLVGVGCGSSAPHNQAIPRPSAQGAFASGYTGHGPKVVIIGDSLTVLGWDELYRALDSHFSVEIGAYFGEGFTGGPLSNALHVPPALLTAAEKYSRSRPAVAVLAVGTNDAWHRKPIRDSLAGMAKMVADLRSACLVGVTIPPRAKATGWSPAVADALNAAMRKWADQVVDWAALSRERGTLSGDGVHPTKRGTALRSDAIVEAVERCGARGGRALPGTAPQ